jgi:hypothetical protein
MNISITSGSSMQEMIHADPRQVGQDSMSLATNRHDCRLSALLQTLIRSR